MTGELVLCYNFFKEIVIKSTFTLCFILQTCDERLSPTNILSSCWSFERHSCLETPVSLSTQVCLQRSLFKSNFFCLSINVVVVFREVIVGEGPRVNPNFRNRVWTFNVRGVDMRLTMHQNDAAMEFDECDF